MNALPIELRIEFGQIRRRVVAELPVHADFLKLVIQGIGFAQVMWITQLTDEIRGAHQRAFFIVLIIG